MLSQRQLRVGELVRHALSDILARGGTYDPDIDRQPITVPEVRMSADLKIATVFVMPLGGANKDTIVKALARNAKPIRGELSRRIAQMKYMPELRFRLDTRFEDDDRMRSMLADPRVAADLSPADPSLGTDDEPPADGSAGSETAADPAGTTRKTDG